MSTEFTVLKRVNSEVVITESSSCFDLDLYAVPEGMSASGPQSMTAEEALNMAAGIIYAVWCSYPDKADELVDAMANNHIPEEWNEIVRKQQE